MLPVKGPLLCLALTCVFAAVARGGTGPAEPVGPFARDWVRALKQERGHTVLAKQPGSAKDRPAPWADAKVMRHRWEVEAGADAILILPRNSLDSSFRFAGAPNLAWGDSIIPAGVGFHGGAYWVFDEDGEGAKALIGVSGGYFSGTYETHEVHSGGAFARETAETRGGWATLDLKYYPERWAYVTCAVGQFIYSVDTHLSTDAVGYQYAGFSGTRSSAVLGLGAGLATPWDHPLQASISGRMWGTDENAWNKPVDSLIAQISAQLHLRF